MRKLSFYNYQQGNKWQFEKKTCFYCLTTNSIRVHILMRMFTNNKLILENNLPIDINDTTSCNIF